MRYLKRPSPSEKESCPITASGSVCLRKREKKRERVRERERGREGKAVNEGGRGRLLPFEKAEKLLGARSQEDFGSERGRGDSCLRPAPYMSFSFKHSRLLQIVSVENKKLK